jgi:hypothetical protein
LLAAVRPFFVLCWPLCGRSLFFVPGASFFVFIDQRMFAEGTLNKEQSTRNKARGTKNSALARQRHATATGRSKW